MEAPQWSTFSHINWSLRGLAALHYRPITTIHCGLATGCRSFRNCSVSEHKELQRAMKTVQIITSHKLWIISWEGCLRKHRSILKELWLFSPLSCNSVLASNCFLSQTSFVLVGNKHAKPSQLYGFRIQFVYTSVVFDINLDISITKCDVQRLLVHFSQ